MGLFQQIEGQVAILVEAGVYKQTDLYSRDGFIYAKAGGGFVRLYADGSTTKSKCRIDALHYDKPLFKDRLGRLVDGQADHGFSGVTDLDDGARRLLGAPLP